ncbi:MAG: AAA family ATPase [Spirochaetota bacterium]|jgi:AAA15 family ATPase/GTPase
MINHLEIQNFKSIKHLQLNCRRVNLFIGEPNTGKSNILEALGLVSWCNAQRAGLVLNEYIRYDFMNNLFFDGLIDEPIKVGISGTVQQQIEVSYNNDSFNIQIPGQKNPIAKLNFKGEWSNRTHSQDCSVRFYRYIQDRSINDNLPPPLATPHGQNLFMVAYSSKGNRNIISNLFSSYGLKAVFKPQEKTIEIQKQEENIIITFPFKMMSDTLQRIVFYLMAIKSNKDATLVFEEPEAHAFPYYTKYLGEIIAADTSNQYFIATHNPYLLNAIIEKAGKEDVGVCITYYKDYQTKVKQLGQDQLELLLDQDPFLAIDQFVEE